MLFAGLRSVLRVKNCESGLKMLPSVTVFHYTDLPAGKEHIYIFAPNRGYCLYIAR